MAFPADSFQLTVLSMLIFSLFSLTNAVLIFSSLMFYLKFSGWFSGGSCGSANRLDGRVAVVTGGNAGIGKETVIELARRGAKVIIGCRDVKKAEEVAVGARAATGSEVDCCHLDLADFDSVRKFADKCLQESRIDLLVNNAGLMMPKQGATTKQGFELHFGVNYLGHFLLTTLLYPRLASSGTRLLPSRVINVSSDGHRFTLWNGQDVDHPQFGYGSWAYEGIGAFYRLYGQSKLAQIYHARELSRVAAERGDNVIALSLHPGAVRTEITRYHSGMMKLVDPLLAQLGKSPVEGAQTTLHCCLTDIAFLQPGGFYQDCQLVVTQGDQYGWYNKTQQEKLWKLSQKMIGMEM